MKRIRIANNMAGFEWAVLVDDPDYPSYAKVCIGGESFWLRNVEPFKKGCDGLFIGVVDNDLLRSNLSPNELQYNDFLKFRETPSDF